jgi:hypothetical protein
MIRSLLRLGGALVFAALLLAPSAQAHAPGAPGHAGPAYGHSTNEWLLMGRNCGVALTPG